MTDDDARSGDDKVDIRSEVVIDKPPSEVWAVIADFARNPTANGSGSRVAAHVRGTPNGVMGLLSPLVTPMVRRSVSGDYRRLKALLED